MLTFGIVLLVVAIFLLFITIIADSNDWDCGAGWIGYIAGCLLTASLTIFAAVEDNKKPTAMDVYQGKTTLQYTVVDSVKVDSVVVWENKK